MVDCEGVSLGSSCAKLPHSHSAEISKTPPPGGPKNAGKMLALRVVMLDDNITLFQVQAKALGRVLFEQVCKQLNLLEADYFGLEYQDHSGTRYWLDLEKQLSRQVGLTLVEPLLHFCVKFYTPDPAQLEEEYTRYLFCLQIKRDLAQGHIQCNDNTAALMASYIVQAECGDYNADDYPDASYLSTYKFVQHQDRELEKKIMENHKKHIGQPPAEADLNLLETARRCELYGMKMHPVKDHEGVPLNLAVAHMGIIVFQSYTKIYTFSWAKIRKISFKRRKFLIKLHPDGYGYYKDTVEFFFESRNECKNLWKKCVENHGFFRCNSVKRVPRQRTRVLSRGSSFRYSGKTQKQMVEFVRENYVKRQNFQRSQSFRQSSSVHSSVATNVGGSISAHPLIPLGDNSIVSVSCGSMVLVGEDSPSLTYRVDQMTHRHSNHSRLLPQPPHQEQQGGQGTTTTAATTTFIPSTSTVVLEKSSSPELEDVTRRNNNNVQENVYTSTPKMNGGPNGHFGELASPELSPMKFKEDRSKEGLDTIDGEMKKKRYSLDKGHFIGKEILMTERTYRKDLEVINLWLRDEFSKYDDKSSITHLLNIIDPLHDAHCHLLKEIEVSMAATERGTTHHRVTDIILKTLEYLPLYEEYIQEHQNVLKGLSQDLTREDFERVYTDFEKNKMCYLPLTLFILKPIQRLIHYAQLTDRLLKFFGPDHSDYADCEIARNKFSELAVVANKALQESENYVQLVELGRDVTGFEGVLTEGDRKFIRHGRLGKFSQRRGTQQRMFVLLSDMLVYSKRYGQNFKVHGQMSLKALRIEDRVDNPTPNSFIIFSGDRPITVSAESQEEKDKWLEDLSQAIDVARSDKNPSSPIFTLKCSNSSDDLNDKQEDDKSAVTPQRSNTTIHVCWHRYTSISLNDLVRAAQNQLSGYLLRKFKNSNGWQKLWVVFTNFCLFFYKTFQDEAPLASLPLLGYCVTTPSEKDQIQKDFVFKLQFKNHVYFFRAESEYTFGRWMEVIGSATQHSGRLRLFSRKESTLEHKIGQEPLYSYQRL
ncbi:FERM, ARHGEF and pleckstrin domain-containing protein 1-like [Cimex lectularius]|uniref:Moesin/ezrin/radixin homolog 1 n=1 Tax=Cimex lectularius TaxID=79782 RepID=A0A8I6SAM3_CIMLE|nr:FERM, ARHGEF and pleckstrin domain-containing protein 1-like [Cimex lectularius]XP_014262154.1 FERM, ARHGEF and pleckstrin domain-containing protein 1-like [Cimex lectularius]